VRLAPWLGAGAALTLTRRGDVTLHGGAGELQPRLPLRCTQLLHCSLRNPCPGCRATTPGGFAGRSGGRACGKAYDCGREFEVRRPLRPFWRPL
jgi:hypothetical protein